MADIPYSLAALKVGIENCKVNIKTFEDAIDRENITIKEYRGMIQHLEEKKAREDSLATRVEVVRE